MFRFNFAKTLEAAACLLRRSPGQEMSYLRLLKLLYIADRESLSETGRPITGDRAVSMDNGPVLSRLYNIVRGEDVESPQWDQHIRKDGYVLALTDSPGMGHLSRYEAEKLIAICDRHREVDDWLIVRETHEFDEWRDPDGSAIPISFEEILQALSKTSEEIEAIRQEALSQAAIAQALEDC